MDILYQRHHCYICGLAIYHSLLTSYSFTVTPSLFHPLLFYLQKADKSVPSSKLTTQALVEQIKGFNQN